MPGALSKDLGEIAETVPVRCFSKWQRAHHAHTRSSRAVVAVR
jgi:hypothetical protein